MKRLTLTLITCLLTVIPAAAQQSANEARAQGQLNTLLQAQQTLAAAQQAGAARYATTLLEEAQWRFQAAQTDWNSTKRDKREDARMRANEALAAARAAIAKSNWLSTNAAIRGLETDIRGLGGNSNVSLIEEMPEMAFTRGNTSKARIDAAEAVLETAAAAGAQNIAGNDLQPAMQNIKTARQIIRGDKSSEAADHLAYMAEMMGRRAYYLAQLQRSDNTMTPLKVERTRLAQAASERRASEERASREASQRQLADLQQRLAAAEQQREQDRQARMAAEQRLDKLVSDYQSAIANANSSDIETLRRQVEDQQIALRAFLDREHTGEQSLSAEIASLREDLDRSRANMNADAVSARERMIAEREQELENLRKGLADEQARRAELDRQQQQAIADAQQRRQELDAQAEAMRQQVEAAQQAAAAAQQNAVTAQQNAQQMQTQISSMEERLAASESETRRLRMLQELSAFAKTTNEERGLVVTLPGIFFDTGKSQLKPGARTTLARIADKLKDDQNLQITIEGHTDSVGSDATNARLSEARAAAVREYLVTKGVNGSRVSSVGKGEGEPVATNKTAAGRQQNRRVELVIQ
ncbi:MAG TPA: OmpA family protein [Thermoanaerobaculia bacterium]|nr:OmpA family protein [Thermoanaerobaculia bacterium]